MNALAMPYSMNVHCQTTYYKSKHRSPCGLLNTGHDSVTDILLILGVIQFLTL